MKKENKTFSDKKKGKGKLPNLKIEDKMPSPEKYNTDRLMVYVKRLCFFFAGLHLLSLAGIGVLSYHLYKALNSDVTYFVDEDGTRRGRKVIQLSKSRSDWEIENFSELFLDKAFCHTPKKFYEKLKGAAPLMTSRSLDLLVSNLRNGRWDILFNQEGASSDIAIEAKSIEPDREAGGWKVVILFRVSITVPTEGRVKTHKVPLSVMLRVSPVPRSKKNPYGLVIKEFQYLNKPKKK